MPHRHFGIPLRTKRRPTYTGPGPAGALSGSAFVGAILVILIVLGVVLYGVSKIVADADDPTTSARTILHSLYARARRRPCVTFLHSAL